MTTYTVPCVFETYNREKEWLKKGGKQRTPLLVEVPGSKSITNRALLLATLAEGESVLDGVLFCDDSRHFLKCVQELGFETQVEEEKRRIRVLGTGGMIPKKQADLYVGSAGTAARFLTACLGISRGEYHMDASNQMKKRPMAPLLAALRTLGCDVVCEEKEGFFPFTLKGNGYQAKDITIDIGNSSQFLSALLISSILAKEEKTIKIQGTHGMSYIHMTEKMMQQFGGTVRHPKQDEYLIPGNQTYLAQKYQVEPDVSAACYFYAMAAILSVPVTVKNVFSDSMQGDLAFLSILEKMGCRIEELKEGLTVFPPEDGILHGVDADMSSCSDQAITLAAIAPFADSRTTIRNVGHIRLQESDRMSAIVQELGKMGIRCEMTEQDLVIDPGIPRASVVATYEDHRMAMGFSLIGLRTSGIVIENPLCCKKTFETYFQVLENTLQGLQEMPSQKRS